MIFKTHRIKVANRLEDLLTIDAVVMRLSVVFVQTIVVLENLATWFTKRVIATIMFQKGFVIREMVVAALAVEMTAALHIMLH